MGIGYRIKEARERMGLTQTELGALIGVTGSAITNYEKETSHPKEQIIYKLMETLNVDANYLFQDAVKIKAKQNDVTLAEYDHIKNTVLSMSMVKRWSILYLPKNLTVVPLVLITLGGISWMVSKHGLPIWLRYLPTEYLFQMILPGLVPLIMITLRILRNRKRCRPI